jgi:hypothetical protein
MTRRSLYVYVWSIVCELDIRQYLEEEEMSIQVIESANINLHRRHVHVVGHCTHS